jgi:hypothetical protein
MILDESNNAMPPEQIKRTEKRTTPSITNEFEGASLQRKNEQSCWKINNEKNKLVVGLWKTSQNYEVTTGH